MLTLCDLIKFVRPELVEGPKWRLFALRQAQGERDFRGERDSQGEPDFRGERILLGFRNRVFPFVARVCRSACEVQQRTNSEPPQLNVDILQFARNSHQTGVWSLAFSFARGLRSTAAVSNRSAACGDSRK
jgi:hypothetical protein